MKRTVLILLAVIAATLAVYWADNATRVHSSTARPTEPGRLSHSEVSIAVKPTDSEPA